MVAIIKFPCQHGARGVMAGAFAQGFAQGQRIVTPA
jgi:hypothetical protein